MKSGFPVLVACFWYMSVVGCMATTDIFETPSAYKSRSRVGVSQRRHWGRHVRLNDTSRAFDDPSELSKRDGTKYVFMHHIVGNTYPYTHNDWMDDILQISAKGVDAIALNIGSSSWQRDQVASAYAAALASNTGMKLFYSFDLTEMPCDLQDLVERTNLYADHPNQFKVDGKVFISSYSGDCLGDAGWMELKQRTNGYLMPFMWGLEEKFGQWPSLDSWYCWGCAWPQGNYAKNTDDDFYYANQLGAKYATTVSGWMYTHLASKNFYLRGDDWLVINRWEQIMEMRSMLTFVEMVTWNDWGESDYYGPFKGAQPDGTFYAEEYPHTAWFDLSQYYITAFKTGVYPPITKSTIYFWARPHPALAVASEDLLGKPSGYDWTENSMWAAVFSTTTSTVTLSCGTSTQTFTVNSGVSKLKIPLAPGQMSVKMIRNGFTIIDYTPMDFTYTLAPTKYNYNAWAGSASASSENPTSRSSQSASSSAAASSGSSTAQSTSVAPNSSALPGSSTQSPSSVASTSSATPTSSTPSSSSATASSTTASSNPTASAWNYSGCYPDSSTRLLEGLATTNDNAQTISTCLTRCANAGYKYAGVEYGNECYCANTIRAGVSAVAESQCTKPCAGAANQVCGGSYLINVYQRAASANTVPASTTTTVNTTPASSSASPTSSNAASSSVGTPATPTTTSWSSYGCVAEGTTGTRRALTGPSSTHSAMTYSMCQSFCAGYDYAGVEYGTQCYCGNTLTNNGGTGLVVSSDKCGVACGGDASKKCGGSWTMSIFTKLPSPAWSSAGCYVDSSTRMLRGVTMLAVSGLTTQQCIASCATAGYTMAGTENGTECHCGSQIFKENGAGVPGTGCAMPCSGNSAQMCGGNYRLNLYLKPGTSV